MNRWVALFAVAIMTGSALAQDAPDLSSLDAESLRTLCRNLYRRVTQLEQENKKIAGLESRIKQLESIISTQRQESEALRQKLSEAMARLGESVPASAPRHDGEWTIDPPTIQTRDAKIEVADVGVSRIPIKDVMGDTAATRDEYLYVRFLITNVSASRKIDYIPMIGNRFSTTRDYATIEDEHGNSYRRIDPGITTKIVGMASESALLPGKSTIDAVVFQRPVDVARSFTMKIPLANVGAEGLAEVKITR